MTVDDQNTWRMGLNFLTLVSGIVSSLVLFIHVRDFCRMQMHSQGLFASPWFCPIRAPTFHQPRKWFDRKGWGIGPEGRLRQDGAPIMNFINIADCDPESIERIQEADKVR